MTCAHVLGLIDAGPIADYPRAHLDAAWRHARRCATCGPALEAATALASDLAALTRPAPPDLAGAVLARIAQIEQARSSPAVAATAELQAPSGTRDWSVWVTALGGLAAGLAIVLWLPAGGGAIDFMSPRIGGMKAGLVAIPSTAEGGLVLATGLVLYVTGLFAPLGGNSRS